MRESVVMQWLYISIFTTWGDKNYCPILWAHLLKMGHFLIITNDKKTTFFDKRKTFTTIIWKLNIPSKWLVWFVYLSACS